MMFLKLSGSTILSHDYHQHDDFTVSIPDTILVHLEGDLMGVYKYKCVDGVLVELSQAECEQHPVRLSNKLIEVRAMRDAKLAECDFVMMVDSSASVECKAAFQVYRQALKDITVGIDVDNVVWPAKPAYVKG